MTSVCIPLMESEVIASAERSCVLKRRIRCPSIDARLVTASPLTLEVPFVRVLAARGNTSHNEKSPQGKKEIKEGKIKSLRDV